MAQGWRGRGAWVAVDLDAIQRNVAVLRRRAPGAALIAVVKADAYGHGAVAVAEAALAAGATRLAVYTCDEGVVLRRAAVSAPILVMGYLQPAEARTVVQHDLTPTVVSVQQALALSVAAQSAGRRVPVHLKVDTGMGRAGVAPSEVVALAERVAGLAALDLEGLFTHFATADEPDRTFLCQQFEVFRWVLDRLGDAGIAVRIRHAANSAATLTFPEAHLEAVRCGIALYGLRPSATCGDDAGLRPALSLRASVARVFELSLGESVGYGRTFVAQRPARIALLPVGYGDGLSRALSNRGQALVHGVRVPIVGRISMDQCTLDVTAVPPVAPGDEAVLLGRQGEEEITADKIAALLGTINYEIVTALGLRLPRLYYRAGCLVGWQRLGEDLPCWVRDGGT